MINYVQGNIFDSNCQALVNPVNCMGVMGKGLALQFKQMFPKMFKEYRTMCDYRVIAIGKPHVYYNGKHPEYIVNFPTKGHWKNPSDLVYIDAGLNGLLEIVKRMEIKSIAMPMLGCGLGGLNWMDVKRSI